MCYSLTGEFTIIDRYAVYNTCNAYAKLQTPSSRTSITTDMPQKNSNPSMATKDRPIGIKTRFHYMCWFWLDIA